MNIKIILITGLLLIIVSGNVVGYVDNCELNRVYTLDSTNMWRTVSTVQNVSITAYYSYSRAIWKYGSGGAPCVRVKLQSKGFFDTEYSSYSSVQWCETDPSGLTKKLRNNLCIEVISERASPGIHTYQPSQASFGVCPGSTGNYQAGATSEYVSVVFTNKSTHNISGYVACVDYTNIYIYQDSAWLLLTNKTCNVTGDTYNFPVFNGSNYKINFSDGHEYEFTVNGANINYDHDVCAYITLNFKDSCNNLIRKIAGTYYNAGDPTALNFYTANGIYNIFYENQDYLEIWVDSASGTMYYNISNPKNNTVATYTLQNPTIFWNNNIFVQDANTSLPIESALVMFAQDCIIDPSSYPSRNKFTNTSGLVIFDQCELDSFSLGVSAEGYKSFSDNNISSNNLSAFLLEQTVIVKLYPSTEENESEYDYTDYGTWINFKDVNGNYTTSILDTDNYVDLYYFNNNTENVSMILKFQKYSISTGTIDLLSWNIPCNTDGHKRVLKSNYTDTSYLYIGNLYNDSLEGWDKIKYLDVRNETTEIDQDYQNLTAFTWFGNKNIEGSIDYREDINIIAYANSTYASLLVISLELYDNGLYVTHTNLTSSDFVGADFKYYYEWNPTYSYANGHNYTVRMHGYDYYLLDMDYINATDYRKNKLTIIVKNQYGTDVDNCFIFLEGWGSLTTTTNSYNSYEGLSDGYYRFKATKPDYVGTGWNDVELSGSDKVVTYVLTSTSGSGEMGAQAKMDDTTLRNLYIPLMAILLILILLGGLKSVL